MAVFDLLPLANALLACPAGVLPAVPLFFASLLIEHAAFSLFRRHQELSHLKLFSQIVLANIASLAAGLLLFRTTPLFLIMFPENSQQWVSGLIIGITFTFLITWIAEFALLLLLNRKCPLPHLRETVFCANLFSYAAIFAIVFLPRFLQF